MNGYSALTAKLAEKLLAGLASKYADLVVPLQVFKADQMPADFDKYAVIVSPNAHPWDERRTAIREVQYIFRVDLFCLVRNYHVSDSVFGSTDGSYGVFELAGDVKDYLRTSDLDGLLDKTYDEAGGDARSPGNGPGGLDFQEVALQGLSSGNYPVVQRIRVPFLGRTEPFCHAKVS